MGRGAPRIFDHEEILRRWAKGQSSTVIAEVIGARPENIRVIIQRARAAGDKRAMKRRPGPSKSIVPHWVPPWLSYEYRIIARRSGEEMAASVCRRLKAELA